MSDIGLLYTYNKSARELATKVMNEVDGNHESVIRLGDFYQSLWKRPSGVVIFGIPRFVLKDVFKSRYHAGGDSERAYFDFLESVIGQGVKTVGVITSDSRDKSFPDENKGLAKVILLKRDAKIWNLARELGSFFERNKPSRQEMAGWGL